MKFFVGGPDFLKGNWSAYGKVCMEPANRRQFSAFRASVVSSVSYLPQPGTAKIKMFSHDFEGFHLKKQNVEVKKGIGLCCPDFYLF